MRCAKWTASVAVAAAAAGAMRLFIKALNLDITDDGTRIAVVKAIGAIALSPSALPQASAGIDAVVRALRHHEKNGGLAEAAFKTMGAYLRCPATRDRALNRYADFGVKATLAAHSSDAAVQAAANEALKAPHA